MDFKFELNQKVTAEGYKENFIIIGRAQYLNCDNNYLVSLNMIGRTRIPYLWFEECSLCAVKE